jgi:hypothetical protein
MNRNRPKKEERTVRAWTYEEAHKAVPYIAAVVRSLREQRLEAQSKSRQAQILEGRPGRPNRDLLVAQADVVRQSREADERFAETLAELNSLDVFCTEPARGEAFIPFLHAKKLAWFVFDLFDEEDHLRQWRYHDDPLEARRPIAEALKETTEIAWMA